MTYFGFGLSLTQRKRPPNLQYFFWIQSVRNVVSHQARSKRQETQLQRDFRAPVKSLRRSVFPMCQARCPWRQPLEMLKALSEVLEVLQLSLVVFHENHAPGSQPAIPTLRAWRLRSKFNTPSHLSYFGGKVTWPCESARWMVIPIPNPVGLETAERKGSSS